MALGLGLAVFNIFASGSGAALQIVSSVLIAGGIFYVLFAISKGKWIGGGDVKLGLLIGLILGSPELAFMMLLGASVLGTLVAIPGMLTKKLSSSSRIPFGPFLIISAILVQLFGASIVAWYKTTLLLEV